jgi:hypothetical protein
LDDALILRFTRLSDEAHRFEYRRPDATGETLDLETASVLFHDLLHFAVESEAGLNGSFYGLVAKIGGYAELSVNGGAALGGEIAVTERVVAALAEAVRDDGADAGAVADQARADFELYGERAPRWLTADFVARATDCMRELEGRWRATSVGETMALRFPLAR